MTRRGSQRRRRSIHIEWARLAAKRVVIGSFASPVYGDAVKRIVGDELYERPPGIFYALEPPRRVSGAPRGRRVSGGAVADPPPCLVALAEKAVRGEHMEHWERFALVAMLAAAGVPVEEAAALFRHQPDFNERIAVYQVRHIYGLVGGGKRYTPFSCNRMREAGMCPLPEGESCRLPDGRTVKNPVQLVRLSARIVRALAARLAATAKKAE